MVVSVLVSVVVLGGLAVVRYLSFPVSSLQSLAPNPCLMEWFSQWSVDPQNLQRAHELAQKAVTLDESLPTTPIFGRPTGDWRLSTVSPGRTQVNAGGMMNDECGMMSVFQSD